ncbi:MAG: adenosylcobalamin-dependent ribonucleoside-diphosphate reductase [Spirochaetia bacterium]
METTQTGRREAWTWRQEISREIFEEKYMLHGESDILDVLRLVAEEVSSAEAPEVRDRIRDEFLRELTEGRLVPAGRILANARPGSPMKNYNNCFTIDVEDSMEGIYDSLKEDALISKMGGGVGFDISKLRPKGDRLSGGGEASGVVSFLRIFDQSAKTIMTGGHRRSAHIALLDISHPDIEEFITVKQGDRNRELTQFNISVKLTDDFIAAVKENRDWELRFHGKVYRTVRARKLFDLLASNGFHNNEPGIFNADTVERYNNGYWAFSMDRVNPCGELVMPPYSLCCLSAVNLTAFVSAPFAGEARFDWGRFEKTVAVGVRFLDNVLDVTAYPLDKIREFSLQWRRIGLGFTGLGDVLCMLELRYGSKGSFEFAEELGRRLRDASYSASARLAYEKGPFPACEVDKLLEAEFVKSLPEDIRKAIRKTGLRNIGLNTVAPTGTISLALGQNCSSGIEPIFSLEYDRRIRTGKEDETRTERVYDYAWLIFRDTYGGDIPAPDYFVTAADIRPKESIEMQAVLQRYIDHSISKTLNLPPGTTVEEYKELLLYAYDKGLKGFTSFNPEGSMQGILESGGERIVRRYAPQRPKELPCDIHSFKGHDQDYIILTGLLNGSLYELFVIDNPEMYLDLKRYSVGTVIKAAKGRYDLVIETGPVSIKVADFTRKFNSPNASLARFISMSLRHGTPLQFIVEQLNKDTNFLDCERGIARVLKKYIRDGERAITGEKLCGSCGEHLIYKEGCLTCPHCGWSKCS